jgi:hypothetical protein
MNAQQKKFILKKLIPFILREQGRGFGMESWILDETPGYLSYVDDVPRAVPVCGTICCIGGSIEVLCGLPSSAMSRTKIVANKIGLTLDQANGLFYEWTNGNVGKDGHVYGWPAKFAKRFARASTPYKKARVAVALLKEVVKTEGECLKLD